MSIALFNHRLRTEEEVRLCTAHVGVGVACGQPCARGRKLCAFHESVLDRFYRVAWRK